MIADGYASTCQTLGYVLRASEPTASLRWYLRAAQVARAAVISLKGLAAGLVAGPREKGAAENASANV